MVQLLTRKGDAQAAARQRRELDEVAAGLAGPDPSPVEALLGRTSAQA